MPKTAVSSAVIVPVKHVEPKKGQTDPKVKELLQNILRKGKTAPIKDLLSKVIKSKKE